MQTKTNKHKQQTTKNTQYTISQQIFEIQSRTSMKKHCEANKHLSILNQNKIKTKKKIKARAMKKKKNFTTHINQQMTTNKQ